MVYEKLRVPDALAATTAWRPAPPRTSCSVTPSPALGVSTTVMMSPSGSESLSRIGRIVDRPARTVTESSFATGGRLAPVRSGLTLVASLLGVSFFAAASAGVTLDQSLMRRIPSVTSQMSPDFTSLRMTLAPLTRIVRLAFPDRFGMSETTGDLPGQLVATFDPTTPYTQPLAETGASTTPSGIVPDSETSALRVTPTMPVGVATTAPRLPPSSDSDGTGWASWARDPMGISMGLSAPSNQISCFVRSSTTALSPTALSWTFATLASSCMGTDEMVLTPLTYRTICESTSDSPMSSPLVVTVTSALSPRSRSAFSLLKSR